MRRMMLLPLLIAVNLSGQQKQSASVHLTAPVLIGKTVLHSGNYKLHWSATAGSDDLYLQGAGASLVLKVQVSGGSGGPAGVITKSLGSSSVLVGFVADKVMLTLKPSGDPSQQTAIASEQKADAAH